MNLSHVSTLQKLSISFHEFKVNDRNLAGELATNKKANARKVRVVKTLVHPNDDEVFARLNSLRAYLRALFIRYTMKWSGDGYRLLANKLHPAFIAQFLAAKDEFDSLAEEFCQPERLEKLRLASKRTMGDLHDDALFSQNIRGLFHVRLVASIVPDGAMVGGSTLEPDARKAVLQAMLDNQKECLIESHRDALTQFSEAMARMVEALRDFGKPGKRLKTGVFAAAIDSMNALKGNNLFEDKEIDAIVDAAREAMQGLRDSNERTVAGVQEKADRAEAVVRRANAKIKALEGLLS